MTISAEHRRSLEALTLRRLPASMVILLAFIGGGLPIEVYYFPERLRTYLLVYVAEVVACVAAYACARRWPLRARAVATVWAITISLCVCSYYPLVDGDATLAMCAVICLVAALPCMLPLGLRHQASFGAACAAGFVVILILGVPRSLPWPYFVIAVGSVIVLSSIGAHSLDVFRHHAHARETVLRDARDQLRTALGQAERAVEMRSRLVANVSHELRTPINVIVGYADILLDADAGPDLIDDAAARIREYAVSLQALVSDLLDLSRLSCAPIELNVSEVPVDGLLADVAAGTRLLVRDKPIEVRVDCGVSSWRTDPLRLRQIISNLATNAAKFTVAGEIVLRARARRGWISFEISDTGCGIPADQHERIFSAFEQVAPAREGGAGIGLGLAIVRQLCDVLGGSVTVTSTPGAGSTFAVVLPDAATTASRARVTDVPAVAVDESLAPAADRLAIAT